ncbi:neurochondrin isoform 2-T4 [Mantella aurantiaca]
MTEKSESTDENPGNSALERCLGVLKAANNDSEQFAALLLVTKCAKASELDNGTRRRIFETVGFTFPNRLLFSKSLPDGCPEYLLRSLGLTLLACFCTDPSLANHPQVLNKIPILNQTVSAPSQKEIKNEASMADDAYQCLVGIMAAPGGIKHLVSGGTISSLSQAYLNRSHGWENALNILITLLTSMPDKSWKKSRRELQLLLVKLSEEFMNEEDSRKFHLAEILPVFLPPSPVLTETSWGKDFLKHICRGLFKILRNKLIVSQRDPALKLGACLSQAYGSSWILTDAKEKGIFFSLLVNLACVEIRMALEDPNPLRSRQPVATACYSLVEMGIQECAKEEAHPMLKEDQKLQLLQVIQEACGAVMYYLQQVGWEKQEDPFVLASVRLLGAWLAEETYCLKQEVIQLLPFLIHYMRSLYNLGVTCRAQPKEVSQVALLCSNWGAVWPGDAIRFLLPAMCHLSAEEAPRRILISEGVPALFSEYYKHQWEVFSFKDDLPAETRSEAELSMQSCCGIFLNLVVTEPALVSQESCFVTLLELLVQSLPVLLENGGHMTLVANISTLGLMISRLLAKTPDLQEDKCGDFFKAAIQFLSRSHVAILDPDTGKHDIMLCEEYSDAWADISELWFLGVQAFSACLPLLPWLSQLVIESGWLHSVLSLFGQVSPESVDLEVVSVLQALFTELAQNNVSCRELIQQQGGVEMANIYGMAALEQCLSEIK